ncbi:UNVERIFIED_CONTAM: Retrovirus-related Pol polyprotein from transposon opus [Sesamum indicum]
MMDFYGIPPGVITHQLNVNPEAKPVKQKRRVFEPERNQAIKMEVDKLLEAKHIRPVQYPEWMANVVLVPKPNGKWRLSIDFTNLNKGILCYNVMSFGLKNVGATYQRLVNDMFKNQIGRNMEVYIDDMWVKSVKEQDHVKDLDECLQILKAFGMKLNPAKCTFGIHFAVADKGRHFFKILRGAAKFEWNRSSQEAFDELNRYLSSPPLLTKSKMGETFYLYLAISVDAVSSVLVRKENREHRPVYYISRMLQGAESRYSQIEKLALSLITAARKLRLYFQSHQVVVLTNHPLKQVLSSLELSRRMVKWAIELSEFGVEFHPRPAIKAQVLADFIVELAHDEASISTSSWTLHVDGSSTMTGNGVGIVLENPEGDQFEYAIKLEYPSSNNEAEYEAFLAGGELALAVGARKIIIYSNSQLVVNQIQGSFENGDEKMAKYSLKAKKST